MELEREERGKYREKGSAERGKCRVREVQRKSIESEREKERGRYREKLRMERRKSRGAVERGRHRQREL